MRTTTTGLQITQRTVCALACLVLGLGALFVGLATSATASDHGANQSGPYDPANVGEGDNQGNGNAPANGMVGKADGKNPPGQYPNGSDHNKGYECDDNKGIGDNGGNPAHSGCLTPAAGDGDGEMRRRRRCAPSDGDGDGDGDAMATATYSARRASHRVTATATRAATRRSSASRPTPRLLLPTAVDAGFGAEQSGAQPAAVAPRRRSAC